VQVQSERRRRGKSRQQTFFQEGEPECRQVAVHTFFLRYEFKCPLPHPADFGAGLLPGCNDLRWQGYGWAFFAGCRAGGPAEGADRQHRKRGHPAHGSLPHRVSGLHDTPRWIDSAGRRRRQSSKSNRAKKTGAKKTGLCRLPRSGVGLYRAGGPWLVGPGSLAWRVWMTAAVRSLSGRGEESGKWAPIARMMMPFHRDQQYGQEVGSVFGEYLTTYSSANGQVRAVLFRKGGASRGPRFVPPRRLRERRVRK